MTKYAALLEEEGIVVAAINPGIVDVSATALSPRKCSHVAHRHIANKRPTRVASAEELTTIALGLRERVSLPLTQLYRLVGVGLRNFRDPEEPIPLLISGQEFEADCR